MSREQSGLLSPNARFMDPLHRASAVGSFSLTEALREAVDGPISTERIQSSGEDFTKIVKKLAKYYGALDCGITDLKPAHIYSHIGRGTGKYGDKVTLDHQFAIAFTVEMDFEMTSYGPYAPVVMESARQYVESARVSIQLAAAIRDLGYPARAHIDGNYRVIAPLVARDAGLGEIGRMGLLMTPLQGPRVRVGVVTTDMPLISDPYHGEPSIIDFCRICKKCAHNCPSQSIPHGEREISNGVLRWQINPESCYHYWTSSALTAVNAWQSVLIPIQITCSTIWSVGASKNLVLSEGLPSSWMTSFTGKNHLPEVKHFYSESYNKFLIENLPHQSNTGSKIEEY